MARAATAIDRRAREAVRALVDAADHYSDEPFLDTLMPELRRLLDADLACSHRVGMGAAGWQVEFWHAAGGPPSVERSFREYIEGESRPSFAYDALHPEANQRNVAIVATSLLEPEQFAELSETRKVLRPLKLDRHEQLRMLVCDGPLLLGWVGVLAPRAFDARDRRLLGALAKPLQRRMRLERRLRDTELRARGFDAVLDALHGAAFLVRGEREVMHANAAGRAMLEARALDLPACVRAARLAPGVEGRVSVFPVERRGEPPHTLVLVEGTAAGGGLEARLARAARDWKLTRRQTEVLRHLVHGEANKTIAERLKCAVSTVEVHVTAILRAARRDSRAALLATFWTTP